IKECALEVWAGDAGNPRPPSNKQPTAMAGDSTRERVKLAYSDRLAKGEVSLPQLPAGKVYWIQPVWVHTTGATRWATANVYKLGAPPVERKAANLAVRFMPRKSRMVRLTIQNKVRVGSDDDDEVMGMTTKATFNEIVQSATGFGSTLSMSYRSVDRTLNVEGKAMPSKLLQQVRKNLKYLHAKIDLDGSGGIKSNTVYNLAQLKQSDAGQDLLDFHEPIKLALDTAFVAMPNKQTEALTSWK